jgi:hypothetical protein
VLLEGLQLRRREVAVHEGLEAFVDSLAVERITQ